METPARAPSRLKVAWLHSHLQHFHSGGTQFVSHYADALQRDHGCSVHFVTDTAGDDARRFFSSHGIRLTEIDSASTDSPLYWLTLPLRNARKSAVVREIAGDVDVVVSSMFPMNLLAGSTPKPHVQLCFEPFAFFHDEACLAALTRPQRAFFRLMAWIYGNADRDAVRRADAVITINASNVARFRSIYGVEPRVIYWGYDIEFWKRAPPHAIAAWRARWGQGPLLLHSTDLSGIKGSFELLAVIERLARAYPSLRILVTTYVDQPDARRRFEAEIERLKLAERVVMLGRLSRDDLPLAYSSVDLVVQPGLSQPANGSLREALLCETPIVGGLVSEEVEEGINGVRVDIRDPDAAASRVGWLLANRAALDLDAHGRRGIADRFPLAPSIRDFRDVLFKVASEHGKRPPGPRAEAP